MRIITGKYRNRVIPTFKKLNYRPSTTKFREAVFSILSSGGYLNQGFNAIKVLDLFSGTGIWSFESLSRGASQSLLVDSNRKHLELGEKFAGEIGAENAINTLCLNILNLPFATQTYDLVFMDPPYRKNYIDPVLKNLVEKKWLSSGAIIVIESESRFSVNLTQRKKEFDKRDRGFYGAELELLKEKIYSQSKLSVLRYK